MKRLGVIPSSQKLVLGTDYIPINHNMKQYYLIYDQLTFGDNELFLKYLFLMRKYLDSKGRQIVDQRISEYREMIEKNIVISVSIDDSKINYTKEMYDLQMYMLEEHSDLSDKSNEVELFSYKFHNHFARWKSVLINQQYSNYKAFPIDNKDSYLHKNDSLLTTQEEVLNIALLKFPVVDNNISWERIIEFKNDSDSHLKFLKLLNWSTDLTKSKYTYQELKEKIDFLTLEYEDALKLHELKYSISTFQSFVLGAAEFIENLIKLKFASILKSALEVKKQKIEMLAAEKQLPGNEIAYFIKATKDLAKRQIKYR